MSSIFIGTARIGSALTRSTFGDGYSFFGEGNFLMDFFKVRPYSTFLIIEVDITGSLGLGDCREIALFPLFPYLADAGFFSVLP